MVVLPAIPGATPKKLPQPEFGAAAAGLGSPSSHAPGMSTTSHSPASRRPPRSVSERVRSMSPSASGAVPGTTTASSVGSTVRSRSPLPIPGYVLDRAQAAQAGDGESGFDAMHKSLKALLDRLDSDNLDIKMRAVAAYLDGYFYKSDSEDVARELTEIVETVHKKCAGQPFPFEPSVAICSALLDQLLLWLSKFQPTMKAPCTYVRNTLLRAVTSGSIPDIPDQPLKLNLQNVEALSAPFMTGLYADSYKEATVLLETARVNSEAASHLDAMKTNLAYWKEAYTQKIFTGWRVHVAAQQRLHKQREGMRAEIEEELQRCQRVEEENRTLAEELAAVRQELVVANEELHDLQMRYREMEERANENAGVQDQLGLVRKKMELLTAEMQAEKKMGQELRAVSWTVLCETEKEPPQRKDLASLPTNIPDLNFCKTFYNSILKRKKGTEMYQVKELEDLGRGPLLLDGLLTFLHLLKPEQLTEQQLAEAKGLLDEAKALTLIDILHRMKLPYELVTVDDLAFSKPYSANATYPVLCLLSKIYEEVADIVPGGDGTTQSEEIPPMPEEFNDDGPTIAKRCRAAEHKKWLWRRSARGVTMSVMYDCLDRIRGNTISRAVLKQFLARIRPENVGDVLSMERVTQAQMITEIHKCVEDYIKVLVKVYSFYAVLGEGETDTDNETMTIDQFMRLLMDSGIVDRGYLPAGEAREMLSDLLCQENTYEGEDPIIDNAMYVELLLRFSIRRYSKDIPNPATCLLRIITLHIIPKAARKDRNFFRDSLRSPEMQTALSHWKPTLMSIFKLYCKTGSSEMKLQDFQKLMKDASEVEGVILSVYQLKQVFNNVQQEDDRTEDDASTLVYHEFVDAVVAAAMIRYPIPWTPLAERFKLLLENHILCCTAVAPFVKGPKGNKKTVTTRLHRGLATSVVTKDDLV